MRIFKILLPLIVIFMYMNIESDGRHNDSYPGWFLKPPRVNNRLFAVGYSPKYYYITNSYNTARQNAMRHLALFNCERMCSHALYQNHPGYGTMFKGRQIEEIPSSDSLHYVVIDSAVVNETVLFLIADDSIKTALAKNWERITAQPPSWLAQLPQDCDYIYGVGIAPIFYGESDSWLAAERESRIDLAANTCVHIRALTKVHDESMQQVLDANVEVMLRHIEILSRWRDQANCFVLSRVHRDSVDCDIKQ
jgi:hypothetical protein